MEKKTTRGRNFQFSLARSVPILMRYYIRKTILSILSCEISRWRLIDTHKHYIKTFNSLLRDQYLVDFLLDKLQQYLSILSCEISCQELPSHHNRNIHFQFSLARSEAKIFILNAPAVADLSILSCEISYWVISAADCGLSSFQFSLARSVYYTYF